MLFMRIQYKRAFSSIYTILLIIHRITNMVFLYIFKGKVFKPHILGVYLKFYHLGGDKSDFSQHFKRVHKGGEV